MKELLEPVVSALEEVSEWQERETSSGAKLLLNTVSSSEFVISLLVTEAVYAFTLPLSKVLQTVNIDLFNAVSLAENSIEELNGLRNNATTAFRNIMSETNQIMMELFGTEVKKPRLTKNQRNRANYQTQTEEEYYKLSIFIPLLDNVIMQLNERFIKHKHILVSFDCLIPNPSKNVETQSEKFESLMDFYKNNLLVTSRTVVLAEFKLWYRIFNGNDAEEFSKTALSALKVCDSNIFPNINILLRIFCAIPVSTSTAERSFSTLKLLKSYLRNTISEDRLNGLTLLYIYPTIAISAEEVLTELQQKKRKLDFVV